MTNKAYVVVEVGYDYDDNYYRSNGSDGRPIHVFFDKNLADKACLDKNLGDLMSLIAEERIMDYLEDGIGEEEVAAYREAGFTVKEEKQRGWTNYSITDFPESLTEEQAKKLFDGINIRWYNTVEVDATVDHFYRTHLKK